MVLPQIEGSSAETLLEATLRVAKPGGRNIAGFRLACGLRDLGIPFKVAHAYMVLFYKGDHARQGSHPYGRHEAIWSLKQAYHREPQDPRTSVDQVIEKMEQGVYDFSLYKDSSDNRLNSHTLGTKHLYCGTLIGGATSQDMISRYIMGVPDPGTGNRKGYAKRYYCNSIDCPLCGKYEVRKLRRRILEDSPSPYISVIPLKRRAYVLGRLRGKGINYHWLLYTSFDEAPNESTEVLIIADGPLKGFEKINPDEYLTLLDRFCQPGYLDSLMKTGHSLPKKQHICPAEEGSPMPSKKEDKPKSGYTYFSVPASIFQELENLGSKIESVGDCPMDCSEDDPYNHVNYLSIEFSEEALRKFWDIKDGRFRPVFRKDDPFLQVGVLKGRNKRYQG
jgi:hypothetical protein